MIASISLIGGWGCRYFRSSNCIFLKKPSIFVQSFLEVLTVSKVCKTLKMDQTVNHSSDTHENMQQMLVLRKILFSYINYYFV